MSGADRELTPEGDGTRVVHRRTVPSDITLPGKVLAPLALGGAEGHADELEEGMGRTLARLKAVVEA